MKRTLFTSLAATVAAILWAYSPVLATVNSFPYAQGFETTCLGSWSQNSDDDFNWTRRSGSTPSSSTGPSSATEGSYYMYVEASSPNNPSKTATLTSDYFDISGLTNPFFVFNYHMYGANMGTIYLEISPNGTNWYNVWSKSGNQGTAWDGVIINLSPYAANPFKLRFRAVTGSGFTSDIAIDDITFSDGTYSGGGSDPACGGGGSDPCDNPVSTFPYSEGFESGFGSWSQSTSDDFNWDRNSGSTGSSGTGPTSAYSGTYYAYTESSNPNYPSKTAILTSPCFDVSALDNAIFNWNYHMYGAEMGTLYLEISPDGNTWYNVWSKSGDQGTQWQGVTANLSAYKNDPFLLRFRGVTGSTYRSDMALDDISFENAVFQKSAANSEYVNATYLETVTDEAHGGLTLFPSPAIHQIGFRIDMEEPTPAVLQVMDLMGSVKIERSMLLDAGWNKVMVDLDLANGNYLLRVKTGEMVQVQKFSVMR